MSKKQGSSKFHVLVADAVSEKGVAVLESAGMQVTVKTGMSPSELAQVIGDYDGLIVRSATKVTAEVLRNPGRLRAIGRAGTGVDNIDLEAATQAGVVVMNTPGGNSVAAAELTMTLLLSMARNVPQANGELREGRWERKKYMGVEVAGKTLGIVGLGRIGREVARRALGFRMQVLGYDPYVSKKAAADCGVESMSLEEMVPKVDFLTLHMPVSDETRHMIDAAMLKRMKPGARVINCARGGLIDETALLAALESEQIAGAALDVYEKEPPTDNPLVRHPHVVATPHLGASTREAQERVGTEIAEKIGNYLESGVILDAVNFPSIDRESFAVLGPVMSLAERLGCFLGQVTEGGFKGLDVRAYGTFAEQSLRPIAMAATKGLLAPIVEAVSYVNSLARASERGITVEESRSNEASRFAGLLRLTLKTDDGEATIAGTLFGDGPPRLVEIDGVSIETCPDGEMLFLRNRDVPGVVGAIGTLLGEAKINIAGIHLGRPEAGDNSLSIINVDSQVPSDVLSKIQELEQIVMARAVTV